MLLVAVPALRMIFLSIGEHHDRPGHNLPGPSQPGEVT
jgi:hypothetical protein